MLAYFQQRSFGHICILKSAKFYLSFKERLTPKLQSSAATVRKLLRLTWSFNCDSRSLMHSNLSQILRLIGDRRQAQSTAITETWKENRTALINRLRRTKDNSLKLGGQQTANSKQRDFKSLLCYHFKDFIHCIFIPFQTSNNSFKSMLLIGFIIKIMKNFKTIKIILFY